MTDEKSAGAGFGGPVKPLAVRLPEDLRAQLDVLAQLTGRSTTEEIRAALEHWVEKSKSDPAVLKQAEAVKAEIEREAQTRRNAIAAIFDGKPSAPTRPAANPPRPRPAKG
ncbi:ribbon-helix-helix protein, CopG family [Tsukamurella tyrosinosolvens]|uniref:ribbon-helix-helix protein, CopG family n=1 Tax=Tsukamurella tyrosinosolvens TaxID=57704 RepID=UPI0009EED568|nr:ribbon-helix-helix protein, CopG family [Tsukamurella tyrosinosolvens]